MKKSLFDKWSIDYEKDIQKFKDQYPFANYYGLIDEIVTLLIKNNTNSVLDIGIGSGFLLNKVLEETTIQNFFGLDFSKNMIEIPSTKFPKDNLLVHDIRNNIPKNISNKKFDAIISTYTMHHFESKEKLEIIKKYFDLINTQGIFIIGDIAFETQEELEKVKILEGESWDYEEADGYIISKDFCKMIELAGFEISSKKMSYSSYCYVLKRN